MPTYTYQCPSCDAQFERVLRLADYEQPQDCECGVQGKRVIAGPVGFVLRGDGWAGKNAKIKGQMAKRRKKLAGKENDWKNDAKIRLAPNVNGERVDSWSEARKLAKSKGKDTGTYDKLVRKERQGGSA